MYRIIAAAAATLVCLCPTSVLADSNELPGYGAAVNPRVMVLFDNSSSMLIRPQDSSYNAAVAGDDWDPDGTTPAKNKCGDNCCRNKLCIGKKVLYNLLPDYNDTMNAGLATYYQYLLKYLPTEVGSTTCYYDVLSPAGKDWFYRVDLNPLVGGKTSLGTVNTGYDSGSQSFTGNSYTLMGCKGTQAQYPYTLVDGPINSYSYCYAYVSKAPPFSTNASGGSSLCPAGKTWTALAPDPAFPVTDTNGTNHYKITEPGTATSACPTSINVGTSKTNWTGFCGTGDCGCTDDVLCTMNRNLSASSVVGGSWIDGFAYTKEAVVPFTRKDRSGAGPYSYAQERSGDGCTMTGVANWGAPAAITAVADCPIGGVKGRTVNTWYPDSTGTLMSAYGFSSHCAFSGTVGTEACTTDWPCTVEVTGVQTHNDNYSECTKSHNYAASGILCNVVPPGTVTITGCAPATNTANNCPYSTTAQESQIYEIPNSNCGGIAVGPNLANGSAFRMTPWAKNAANTAVCSAGDPCNFASTTARTVAATSYYYNNGDAYTDSNGDVFNFGSATALSGTITLTKLTDSCPQPTQSTYTCPNAPCSKDVVPKGLWWYTGIASNPLSGFTPGVGDCSSSSSKCWVWFNTRSGTVPATLQQDKGATYKDANNITWTKTGGGLDANPTWIDPTYDKDGNPQCKWSSAGQYSNVTDTFAGCTGSNACDIYYYGYVQYIDPATGKPVKNGESYVYKCKYGTYSYSYTSGTGLTCNYSYRKYAYTPVNSNYCRFKKNVYSYVRSWAQANGKDCKYSVKEYDYQWQQPSGQLTCAYDRTEYKYQYNSPWYVYKSQTQGGEMVDFTAAQPATSKNWCLTTYNNGFDDPANDYCPPAIKGSVNGVDCTTNECLLRWRTTASVGSNIYSNGRYSNTLADPTGELTGLKNWTTASACSTDANCGGAGAKCGGTKCTKPLPTYCIAPDWGASGRQGAFAAAANPKDLLSDFCYGVGSPPNASYAVVSDWYDPSVTNPLLADGKVCGIGTTAKGVCTAIGVPSEYSFISKDTKKTSGWSRDDSDKAASIFIDFPYSNDSGATMGQVRGALTKCAPPADPIASWSPTGICTSASNMPNAQRFFTANAGTKTCPTITAADNANCAGRACVANPIGDGKNYCDEMNDFTPLYGSLKNAGDYFKERLNTDPDASCAQYYLVLVTDGLESTPLYATRPQLLDAVGDLRGVKYGSGTKDVETFVIGFGAGAAATACTITSDCASSYDCQGGRCLKQCSGDADCSAGFSCDTTSHCIPDLDLMARQGGTSMNLTAKSYAFDPSGTALSATDESSLTSALAAVFNKITSGKYTRSRPAISTDGKRVYAAYFDRASNSQEWAGHLNAYLIGSNGSLTLEWEYNKKLDAMDDSKRNIQTYIDDTGKMIPFKQTGPNDSDAPSCMVSDWYLYRLLYGLSTNACDAAMSTKIAAKDYTATWTIQFLRNAGLNEQFKDGSAKLSRASDIFHSYPIVVSGSPYDDTYGGSNVKGYQDFKAAINGVRETRIIFGANDGMLHALREGTKDANCGSSEADPKCPNGSESWAVVPTPVLGNLANNRIKHTFSVDGYTTVADVCTGSCDKKDWRTLSVTGLREGGNAMFALDITDASNPKYLWNFTDGKMGNAFSSPAIGRAPNGTWTTIIGGGLPDPACSGFCGDVGAHVWALDAVSGAQLFKADWSLPHNEDKVVSKVAGWRAPASPYMEKTFFGTYGMRLYKMDLSDSQPQKWGPKEFFDPFGGDKNYKTDMFGNNPTPVYYLSKTTDGNGLSTRSKVDTLPLDPKTYLRQPIFDRARVAQVHDTSGVDIFVGTGDSQNPTSTSGDLNFFFALHDDGDDKAHPLWILKFDANEKIINDPQLVNGNLVFASYVPPASGTGCFAAGDSYLWAVNPDTGQPVSAISDPNTSSAAPDKYKSVVKCENCGIVDMVCAGDTCYVQPSAPGSNAGPEGYTVKGPASPGAVRSWRRTR